MDLFTPRATVTTTYREHQPGDNWRTVKDEVSFESREQAERFMNNETQYEDTKECVCTLDDGTVFKLPGAYSSFHSN